MALLACRMDATHSMVVGLLLNRTKGSYVYHVGAFLQDGFARCVSIVDDMLARPIGVDHKTPIYAWADIYILQKRHISEPRLPKDLPARPGNRPKFVAVPRWTVDALEVLGFATVQPESPHVMQRIDSSNFQTFIFEHSVSKEQLHVRVGWCSVGLWINVELLDTITGNSRALGHVHELPGSRGSQSGLCPHGSAYPTGHIDEWASTAPHPTTPDHSSMLDATGLRWTHYRTVSDQGRSVHLRVVESSVARGHTVAGSLFVLGVMVPAMPWEARHRITGTSPPPPAAPTTPTEAPPDVVPLKSLPTADTAISGEHSKPKRRPWTRSLSVSIFRPRK